MAYDHNTRGMSLIEIVMGVSIMLIVFAALFAALTSIDTLGRRNELRTSALYLANEHIETMRALPYDSIGTVSGLPYGTIPQVETITHNGHTFVRRTFIQYVDDPSDGLGATDATIPADYKRIKVELSYAINNATSSFSLVTTIAPKSQESLEGAGILRINVTDANNDPLGGVTVDVENFAIATTVDITTFTNVSGTVSLPGAWAGAGYDVLVSKAGYSTAQTYPATIDNPNPSPSALTVAENSTTEIYLKIDRLSTIDLYARELPTRGALEDSFADASGMLTMSDTAIAGGALVLAGTAGSYATTGTSTSITLTPASIDEWVMFRADTATSADHSLRFQLLHDTGGGVYQPIPDGDLAGNEAGFSHTPIDLRGLDPLTYTALRIEAVLETSDPMTTPEVHAWSLSYREPDTPHGNMAFDMTGAETIGEDGGVPVLRYDETHTTDGAGALSLADMSFDLYTLTFTGLVVAEACPALPLDLPPDTSYEQALTLTSASTHSLALQVLHPLGTPIENAEVVLDDGSTVTTTLTGPCGIAYTPNLSDSTYSATVYAPGLASTTVDIPVSGATAHVETLSFW